MSDDFNKMISTPRGPGRSMTALSPSAVSVSFNSPSSPPGTGPDWFGPLQPLTPIAPPEVAGRAWDFSTGYNLATQPRAYEPVTFAALRALADSYDPVRLIIERRKDQMCRLPWAIRPKHEGRGKRPAKAQLSAATRERIADVTDLFKRPEYGKTFRGWLRELLEDLFVLDAPALFLRRDSHGGLTAIQNMDGATLKRVINDWGRTPEPFPWAGEPFNWNGQEVNRESFAKAGFKLLHGIAYPPCWQQILKGLPATNLTALDLLYRPANIRPGRAYGMSPCEQILTTVAIAMRRSLSQLEYFREGNMPEGIYSLPATWTPDQVQRFQDYWDSLYSGNLANRRHLKFTAGDGKYTPFKEPPLKNEFDEWLVRIVCFAFSYPPTAFVQLSNRSIAEQHEKTGEEEGLQSVKQWAADLFNEVIEHHLDEEELEFAWIEEDEVDQEKQSTILTRYAESGIITINQARERLGEEPDPSPNANRLMVKTATGYVPLDGSREAGEATKIHKSTFAAPASATSGLQNYDLEGDKKRKRISMLSPKEGSFRGTSGKVYRSGHKGEEIEVLPGDVEELKRQGFTVLT